MSEQPTPDSEAPDGPLILSLSKDEDFARPLLEAQLAGLNRMAAIGLDTIDNLGRILAREAEAAERDPKFDAKGVGLAQDRACRALRLTYALQYVILDRLDGVARKEGDKAEKAQRNRDGAAREALTQAKAEDQVTIRKTLIGKVVDGVITDAHGDDGEAIDRHIREAERLRDHEVLENVLGRPTSEVIADICRLLGLEPNWEGLAFEAWAVEERQGGKVGAPLRSPPPWMGRGPGIRGRLLKAEEPPLPEEPPVEAQIEEAPPPEPELAPPPPPYVPPPDPDILPGYAVGLPGELPPSRPDRRARPAPPPTNYTRGFV